MRRGVVMLVGLGACTPDFDDAPWRIEESRVLAIVSEPAEARPGEAVQLSSLIVSPQGATVGPAQWSVCTRPRTSAERTSVTQSCLQGEGLEPITPVWSLLADACARFGPNSPPSEGDAVAQRPSDPDASGGYFVPVRAATADAEGFGTVRVRCDLPGVTRAIFEAYEAQYALNENPTIAMVSLIGDAEAALLPTVASAVAPAMDVGLEVTLGSGAAESYVRYAVGEGELVQEREWLRVQWFVTDGELSQGQQLLDSPEGDSVTASVQWTAPVDDGIVHGWVVVTDARGGSAWRAFTLSVE